MGSDIVYVLVLITYSAWFHEVSDTEEIMYALSHSNCLTALQEHQNDHRREGYNQSFHCIPVHDPDIRNAIMDNNHSNNVHTRPGTIGDVNIYIDIN